MALPASTANWHWKSKGVTPWAREWFERELVQVVVSEEGVGEAKVSSVTSLEGDVELSQRKSKVIAIYDCRIELEWSGTANDGTEVTGKLVVPEVSHEITLDGLGEYVFEWTLKTAPSDSVNALFALVKARLATALDTKFAEFPTVLIDTHGKDIFISAAPSPSVSGTSTPAPSAKPHPQPEKKQNGNDKLVGGTRTVVVEATFQAAADDLFSLFTDDKRIPMWSRAAAVSSAQVGTPYSLFNGGVKGEYKALTRGKEIVQTWALQSPTWPSGHSGTLTTSFDQSTDSTKVTFSLAGVPTALEDEIKRNIEGYYVHGLKSIGLGTEL